MTSYIAPATKILRYPAVLAAMQRGERVYPLHAELDMSGICNAHCGHCRFGDGRQGGDVMGEALAYRIIDELVGVGARAVTFSGGGEPTCSPAFEAAVCYAAHEGLAVGVYTNGILRDRVLRIKGVTDWVYVSLDADNREDYEAIKGVDAFGQVCDTIRSLAYSAHRGVVGVGFLLTAGNWHRAEAMQRLGKGLGVDYVQFRPVAGLMTYAWVPDALVELERIGAMHAPERFAQLYDHWRGVYERGYSECWASELGPCIGSDGTVWVCPNTRGLRSLGNLGEESLMDIWERRATQRVGDDCEPTCRHHALNQTLALVCEQQPHEAFV